MIATIHISAPLSRILQGSIELPTSKSLCNRALILAAAEPRLSISGISDAADSQALLAALSCQDGVIDVGHGGTTLRFALAHFATQDGTQILTGTKRLMARPVSILVDALNNLGADILHLGDRIQIDPPKRELGGSIQMAADVSSQFVTALLLIGWRLPLGLEIEFLTKVTSRPYIDMTIGLMKQVGLDVIETDNGLQVDHQTITQFEYTVEPDWSAASYIMSLAALSKKAEIQIKHLRAASLQGDSQQLMWFESLGLEAVESGAGLTIRKIGNSASRLDLDLEGQPDLAQTLAVICAGLNMPCMLTGLHTLPIKETDRLVALHNELATCGVKTRITDASFELIDAAQLQQPSSITTYQDHRMAMAFAPLALRLGEIIIDDPSVVDKSFPSYWNMLEQLGFRCTKID